jgi:glycosyltransferase involved in cell wall biosynthesis
MNILFVSPRFHPNQQAWISSLHREGHKVRYITSYSVPSNERYDTLQPITIKACKQPLFYRTLVFIIESFCQKSLQPQYKVWPEIKFLQKSILSFQPDIIIMRESLTPLSLMTQRTARANGIPTIQSSQADLTAKNSLVATILKKIKCIPDYRITPVKTFSNICSAKNTSYVPLFVPPVDSPAEHENVERALQILFVGKFNSRRKKHLLLLEAIAILKKQHPVRLTMVGSTIFTDQEYYQEVKEKIVSLKLTQNVKILEDIPPEEMNEVYQKHDVFVLPSIQEPFSISPLEAMAHGLPTIVTDTNGCRGHITHGENGFIVSSNNLGELVSAIYEFTNKETLTLMGAAAKKYNREENNELLFITQFMQAVKNANMLQQPNSSIHE